MKWSGKWPRLFTEPDGVTPCPIRIGGFAVMIMYHVFMFWIILHHGVLTFDNLTGYTQNMALLIGIGAGSIGAKAILRADTPYNTDSADNSNNGTPSS